MYNPVIMLSPVKWHVNAYYIYTITWVVSHLLIANWDEHMSIQVLTLFAGPKSVNSNLDLMVSRRNLPQIKPQMMMNHERL